MTFDEIKPGDQFETDRFHFEIRRKGADGVLLLRRTKYSTDRKEYWLQDDEFNCILLESAKRRKVGE